MGMSGSDGGPILWMYLVSLNYTPKFVSSPCYMYCTISNKLQKKKKDVHKKSSEIAP
jgi:hypothetical protein